MPKTFVLKQGIAKSVREIYLLADQDVLPPMPPGEKEFLKPGTYRTYVPIGIYEITLYIVAGGGGGGGGGGRPGGNSNYQWGVAGGGGSAGELKIVTIAVTPGTPIDIVVGDGGIGGAAASTGWGGTGANGQNTTVTINGVTYTVAGGKGGQGGYGYCCGGEPNAGYGGAAVNGSGAGGRGSAGGSGPSGWAWGKSATNGTGYMPGKATANSTISVGGGGGGIRERVLNYISAGGSGGGSGAIAQSIERLSPTTWVADGFFSSTAVGAQWFELKFDGTSFYYKLYNQTTFTKYTGATDWSTTSYGSRWRNEGEKFRINSITYTAATGVVSVNVDVWDALMGIHWNMTWTSNVNNWTLKVISAPPSSNASDGAAGLLGGGGGGGYAVWFAAGKGGKGGNGFVIISWK